MADNEHAELFKKRLIDMGLKLRGEEAEAPDITNMTVFECMKFYFESIAYKHAENKPAE